MKKGESTPRADRVGRVHRWEVLSTPIQTMVWLTREFKTCSAKIPMALRLAREGSLRLLLTHVFGESEGNGEYGFEHAHKAFAGNESGGDDD